MMAYLVMMTTRLLVMHQVLNPPAAYIYTVIPPRATI